MNDKLAAALIAAQKEMPAVEKTARANYGTYATLDHIIALTRPVLNKHGLTITQWPTVTELGQPALRTTITHVSGESDSSVMPLFMAKQDMQQLGSALTYGRRYAWAAALAISSESDDDGAATTRTDGAAPKTEAAPKQNASTGFVAPASSGRPASDAIRLSDAQLRLLKGLTAKLIGEKKITEEQLASATGGVALDQLTKRDASSLIERLKRYEENVAA